jgi:hypothetical protein
MLDVLCGTHPTISISKQISHTAFSRFIFLPITPASELPSADRLLLRDPNRDAPFSRPAGSFGEVAIGGASVVDAEA